jgi:hypothetical protein
MTNTLPKLDQTVNLRRCGRPDRGNSHPPRV